MDTLDTQHACACRAIRAGARVSKPSIVSVPGGSFPLDRRTRHCATGRRPERPSVAKVRQGWNSDSIRLRGPSAVCVESRAQQHPSSPEQVEAGPPAGLAHEQLERGDLLPRLRAVPGCGEGSLGRGAVLRQAGGEGRDRMPPPTRRCLRRRRSQSANARATSRDCSARRAASSARGTSERSPKPSASAASTPAPPTFRDGWRGTTTNGPTPPSAATRRSADWPLRHEQRPWNTHLAACRS